VQSPSVLMASVRELHDAYQTAVLRCDPDVDLWRRAYMERLVMLCDVIEYRAGTIRANGGE